MNSAEGARPEQARPGSAAAAAGGASSALTTEVSAIMGYAGKVAPLLALIGLVLYFFVGTAYRGYYARFGVAPEDVGITRGALLDRVGVNAVALFAGLGVVGGLMILLDQPDQRNPPAMRERPWYGPLVLALGGPFQVAAINHGVLGWWRTALAAAACALAYVIAYVALQQKYMGRQVREYPGVTWIVAALLVLFFGYAVAWEIGSRTSARDIGGQSRDAASSHERLFPPTLLDAHIVPVRVERVDGKAFSVASPRLLGEANGVYVLTGARETVRVPVGAVVLHTGRPG